MVGKQTEGGKEGSQGVGHVLFPDPSKEQGEGVPWKFTHLNPSGPETEGELAIQRPFRIKERPKITPTGGSIHSTYTVCLRSAHTQEVLAQLPLLRQSHLPEVGQDSS